MAQVDVALLEVAAAARVDKRAAKAERARVVDALIALLLERAEVRLLVGQALPYLWTAPARSEALADRAFTPKELARQLTALLDLPPTP